MGRRIDQWVADDGASFDTQAEMLNHELLASDAKVISVFLSDGEHSARKIKEYSTLLMRWQEYSRALDPAPISAPVNLFENADSPLTNQSQEWKPSGAVELDAKGDFIMSKEAEEAAIEASFK